MVDAGRASRQDIDEALARLLLGHVRPAGERCPSRRSELVKISV
jgi:hypothetical protein